jgi:hypothetical protein
LGTIQEWICAQNQPKKMKKMDDLKEKWVSGWLGTKWEIWRFGWPAVAMGGGEGSAVMMGGGEGSAVMSWWWGRWLSEVGVGVFFGFREERDGRGFSGCTADWEKWGREGGGKCDLKQVTQDLKLSTFECT